MISNSKRIALKIALGALAATAFGGVAQAADIKVSSYREEYGSYHRLVENRDRNDGFEDRFREPGQRMAQYERFREPERRFRDRGDLWRPDWGRRYDDCRTVVRRRINRWGEVIVRRIRVCDW